MRGSVRWWQLRPFVQAWAHNETVGAILTRYDTEPDPADLPIMADALQDVGVPDGHPVLGALRKMKFYSPK